MLVLGWTFLEFVSADGKAPFSIWLSEQPVEAQAAIDNRILMMMNLATIGLCYTLMIEQFKV